MSRREEEKKKEIQGYKISTKHIAVRYRYLN